MSRKTESRWAWFDKTSNNSGENQILESTGIFRVASQKTKPILFQKKGYYSLSHTKKRQRFPSFMPDSERVAGLNRENEKDKEKNKEAFRISEPHMELPLRIACEREALRVLRGGAACLDENSGVTASSSSPHQCLCSGKVVSSRWLHRRQGHPTGGQARIGCLDMPCRWRAVP